MGTATYGPAESKQVTAQLVPALGAHWPHVEVAVHRFVDDVF